MFAIVGDRLRFKFKWKKEYHNVDDQNCNVAKGGTTRTKVGEGFVAGSINDQETWNFHLECVSLDSLLLL